MLMTTSDVVSLATRRRSLSMSAPFLPMTTPGRAEWIVTRHFRCGRSITIFDTAACFSAPMRTSRIFMSSCSSLPYSTLLANPARIPGAVDAEPQPDRIDLLTHRSVPQGPSFDFANHDREVRERLFDPARPTAGPRAETLHHHGLAHIGFGHHQVVDIQAVVVLGIGDSALESLAHLDRASFARELQVGERRIHLLAADPAAPGGSTSAG